MIFEFYVEIGPENMHHMTESQLLHIVTFCDLTLTFSFYFSFY